MCFNKSNLEVIKFELESAKEQRLIIFEKIKKVNNKIEALLDYLNLRDIIDIGNDEI